jgi:hypothetical protein
MFVSPFTPFTERKTLTNLTLSLALSPQTDILAGKLIEPEVDVTPSGEVELMLQLSVVAVFIGPS